MSVWKHGLQCKFLGELFSKVIDLFEVKYSEKQRSFSPMNDQLEVRKRSEEVIKSWTGSPKEIQRHVKICWSIILWRSLCKHLAP